LLYVSKKSIKTQFNKLYFQPTTITKKLSEIF